MPAPHKYSVKSPSGIELVLAVHGCDEQTGQLPRPLHQLVDPRPRQRPATLRGKHERTLAEPGAASVARFTLSVEFVRERNSLQLARPERFELPPFWFVGRPAFFRSFQIQQVRWPALAHLLTETRPD